MNRGEKGVTKMAIFVGFLKNQHQMFIFNYSEQQLVINIS